MGLITVEGIRVFAYHGHLPEEAKLGGHFIVNIWVTADTTKVEKSDDLNDTVDYVKIIEIVKQQKELLRPFYLYKRCKK
jgi:dihydroneopterin aldolase